MTDFEQEEQVEQQPRRGGCRRTGCLTCGVLLAALMLAAAWAAVLQTQLLEKIGLKAFADDSQLSGVMVFDAAQALKDELLRSGFSEAGLQVAVLPMKEQGYNLAVVELDASLGFSGNTGGDVLVETFKRLASGPAASQYNIGRVALHYKDNSGKKLVSLTARTSDIQAFASGRIDRRAFLQAVEGEMDYGSIWEGLP